MQTKKERNIVMKECSAATVAALGIAAIAAYPAAKQIIRDLKKK